MLNPKAMGNVITWQRALDMGWKPGHYSYAAEQVPVGSYEVILDFKIWAKKLMAVNCYCTVKATGKKIQLTIYCLEAGVYRLPGSMVNFATCPTQSLYVVEVIADQRKKIKVMAASPVC